MGVAHVGNNYNIKWRALVNESHVFPVSLGAQYPLLGNPGFSCETDL